MIDRESPLAKAFRFHRAAGLNKYRGFAVCAAVAITKARADVAAGKARYPSDGRHAAPFKGLPYPAVSWSDETPGLAHVSDPDAAGLRFVGAVETESRRGDCWQRTEGAGGWYTDPHGDVFRDGSGLCYGVVYQLPGRAGAARFVAGYVYGGTDGGPSLDLATIYTESDCRAFGYVTGPRELDAARDAAGAADSMAQRAAEAEREYQTAWQAGRLWAERGEEIEAAKAAASALLSERKAARAKGLGEGFPALCAAIRGQVSSLVADIAKAREERAALLSGEAAGFELYWFTGEEHLQAAFCEAAGIDAFPTAA